jgi:type IV fimbrial biogenesis protein FimT
MDSQEGGDVLTRRSPADHGFSLIELMVTVVLIGIVMSMAMPSFSRWIKNSQVRVISDAVQSGLRLAQSESMRRYRQVVFFRTAAKDCTSAATASAGGLYWQIRTVAAVTGDPVQVVQCGVLTDVANDISIAGPTAVCFNADGRQVANAATGVTGAVCALDAEGAASAFDITHIKADRPLRVRVSLAGSIRICDPSRDISTHPDGCLP